MTFFDIVIHWGLLKGCIFRPPCAGDHYVCVLYLFLEENVMFSLRAVSVCLFLYIAISCSTSSATWSEPAHLEELNPPYTNLIAANPFLNEDGTRLYFAKFESSPGDREIFYADLDPVNGDILSVNPVLGLSQGYNKRWLCVSPDELTLYYTLELSADQWVIQVAKRDAITSAWDSIETLTELSITSGQTFAPSLTPDGLTIYYSSNNPDASGNYSIWRATRSSVDDPFGTPEQVSELNSERGGIALLRRKKT